MKRRTILGIIVTIMVAAMLSAGLVTAGGNAQESDPVAALQEWGLTEAEATTLVNQGQAVAVLEALAEYEQPAALESTGAGSTDAEVSPPATSEPPPAAPTATPAPTAAPTVTPAPSSTPTPALPAAPTPTPTPEPEPEPEQEQEGGQQAAAGAAPDYNILSATNQDGHLVVHAEHYRDDGTFWFDEYYVWSGKEGVKFDKATNLGGELLLSDGSVAPYDAAGDQYLPEDAEWMYTTETLLTQNSIIGVINSIHASRTASGYAGGAGSAPSLDAASGDNTGAAALAAEFDGMAGSDFSAD